MKKLFILLSILSTVTYANAIHDKGTNVVWTAVFENAKPIKNNINQAYCDSHTPSVISTNIVQITSKDGVKAANGVNIRYISYKGEAKDNLYFNVVSGELSGIDVNGKPWKQPIKLYEQTLDEIGKTYTVWSTPNCKGTFTGFPTIISK